MSRFKLGPALAPLTLGFAPTPPPDVVAPQPPSAKLDVEVSAAIDTGDIVSHGETGWAVPIDVTIPAYGLATHNRLLKVHAAFAPATSASLPTDAAGWVADWFPHAEMDVAAYQSGGTYRLTVAGVPAGGNVGQVVLEFTE